MLEEYDYIGKLKEGFRRVKKGALKDSKCGFVDENGDVVIPLIYSNVHDFHEGMAAVRMGNWANNEWGYINTKGELIIPLKYNYPHPFENGLLKTRIGKEWLFLDKQGDKVIDISMYDHVLTFSGNYAVVSKYGAKGRAKMGVIDRTGREIIPCIYPYVSDLKKCYVESAVELYLRDSKLYHRNESEAKPLTDEEWNQDKYAVTDYANTETVYPAENSSDDIRGDVVNFTPEMLSVLVDAYEKPRLSQNDVVLIATEVAGTTYRKNIAELEPFLKPEQVFWMVREPWNRYDPNAIAIYFGMEKLGYIPAEQNEIIARLMDYGRFFYCKLTSKEWIDSWLCLKIEVFIQESDSSTTT